MGTYYHGINKLKRGTLPRRFIILAVAPVVAREGHGRPLFLHRLRLGALTYMHRDGQCSWSLKSAVFDSAEQLLNLLDRYSSRREATWVFSHDLAYNLTVSGVWKYAKKENFVVQSYHIAGKSCTARIRIRNKLLHCVDSRNFLDSGWEWMCGALGTLRPPPFADSDADSQALDTARLQTSTVCELVQRLVMMCDNDAGGAWGYSLGGIAWQSWRRGLMGDKVHVHAHEEATDLEREAYVGARTECRYIGETHQQVTVVDYNSLYAHVMTDCMPVKLEGVQRDCRDSEIAARLRLGHLAIARVTLDCKNNDFPYKYWPHNSEPPTSKQTAPAYISPRPQWKRGWARGQFTTVLATPELQRALESEEIAAVDRVAWYNPGNPFSHFVDYWYARRVEYKAKNRIAEEAIAKRILTVLPGKFGQHAHEWVACPKINPAVAFGHWWAPEVDTNAFVLYRAMGGCTQKYISPGEWKHAFPAISAHVTSGARVLTDAAVEIAGPLDCFYFDCDALHVTHVGLERLDAAGLLHETELGRMKIKGVYNGGHYRNIRDCHLGTSEQGSLEHGGEVARRNRKAQEEHCILPSSISSDRDAYTVQFPTVHGGSNVDNLVRPPSDAWRSIVSVRVAERYRYFGRVAQDGWVRPLWLPQRHARPEQVELIPLLR